MEYMIFSLPVIAFDLKETKKSGQDAVYIVDKNADPVAMADGIELLVQDENKRRSMGEYALKRVMDELIWDHQSDHYVGVMMSAYKKSRRFT